MPKSSPHQSSDPESPKVSALPQGIIRNSFQSVNIPYGKANLTLFIDDTANLSVTELRAKAKRLVREHGVKMIAIDYLQLMSDGENSTPRDSDISKITHSLKELSRELDFR